MSASIQYDSCSYEKRRGDTDTQGKYHVMIKKKKEEEIGVMLPPVREYLLTTPRS